MNLLKDKTPPLTEYRLMSKIMSGPVAPTMSSGWAANRAKMMPLTEDMSSVSPTPM